MSKIGVNNKKITNKKVSSFKKCKNYMLDLKNLRFKKCQKGMFDKKLTIKNKFSTKI